MEAKYTKGNWTLGNSALYPNGKGVFDEKGIAYVCQVSYICGKEEAEANAKLISVAPELLNALNNLINAVGGGNKHCEHDFECNCAMDEAKKVIKKATE